MNNTDLSVGCESLRTSKESLINYLRNNPESVAPSTYLRDLLIADMVQNGGAL